MNSLIRKVWKAESIYGNLYLILKDDDEFWTVDINEATIFGKEVLPARERIRIHKSTPDLSSKAKPVRVRLNIEEI